MSAIQFLSDTLIATPLAGTVEYNGSHFLTDSTSSRAQVERLVLSTAQATTSGNAITFAGIPAWAKRITVMFNGVGVSGSSVVIMQLSNGGIAASGGYTATRFGISGTTVFTSTSAKGLFVGSSGGSANTLTGSSTINLIGSNTWVQTATIRESTTQASSSAGSIVLTGQLDGIVITTTPLGDTFTAGSVNILVEG